MNKPHNEIFVRREVFRGNRFEFLMFHHHDAPGLVSHVSLKLETITPENEQFTTQPSFSLSAEETQGLFDELWRTGLRPTQAVNEQSALPFISAHLEDMRRLVFESREITPPLVTPTIIQQAKTYSHE